MPAPSSQTTTPVQWFVQSVSVGSLTVLSARLEIDLFLRTALPGLQIVAEIGWVDTGAPLSVIPFHIHNGRLDWRPIPGVQLTWLGQSCDLGTIDIWLPTQETSALRGPLTLLAKFPRSDPPGSPVPILLGLEFFLSNQAGMNLLPPPQKSEISVP
jgi:hypothetical protein